MTRNVRKSENTGLERSSAHHLPLTLIVTVPSHQPGLIAMNNDERGKGEPECEGTIYECVIECREKPEVRFIQ